MSLTDELLQEIQSYAAARGIAESIFGRLAVNDGKFVGRLRAGHSVTVRLIERARQYIRDNPGSGTGPEAA